jgi:hypothetical protein
LKNYGEILKGDDLRSIGKVNQVVKEINNQNEFDNLFKGLFSADRKVVMRTADAIEKITLTNLKFLRTHKKEILELCFSAKDKELKWHLALLVSRLPLTPIEKGKIWKLLTEWATGKKESKIVRVNSVQGLYNFLQSNKELERDFNVTADKILNENIPSLNARIRIIRNVCR